MSHQTPEETTSTALEARGGALGEDRRNGMAPQRSPEQIERDIKATRQRLAGTVDEIAERVHPANVGRRTLTAAKAQVVHPVAGPRYNRIGIIAAVLLLVVALRVWRSRRG